MSREQPWNVGSYNTQPASGGGGVQLYDPTKFQTTVTASVQGDNIRPQLPHHAPGKTMNLSEYQTTTMPGYTYGNNIQQGTQYAQGLVSGDTTVQGHGAVDWANGNQWQGGGTQNYASGHNLGGAPGQNYFNPGEPQQWQNWNSQQSQWNVQQQQPQQQQPGQQPSYWTQQGDPVWQSLEPQQPWLNQNENGSWGSHHDQAPHDQAPHDQAPHDQAQQQGSQYNPTLLTNTDGQNVDGHTGIHSDPPYSTGNLTFNYRPLDGAQNDPNQGPQYPQYSQYSQNTEQAHGTPQFNLHNVGTEEESLNDSGTVSSFFGGGDYDESVTLSSLPLSSEGVNPVLLSVPSLNRTTSEISNSSLQTYNNSSLDSLEGENSLDVLEVTDKLKSASLQDSSNVLHPGLIGHSESDALPSGQNPSPMHSSITGAQQYHTFSDTHSLSSHHSGDSLGNSLNQETTPTGLSQGRVGQHSHHSSLDSVDLLLGSGGSSLAGTPGRLPNPGRQYSPSPIQPHTEHSDWSPGQSFSKPNMSNQELSAHGHHSLDSIPQGGIGTNFSPPETFSNIHEHPTSQRTDLYANMDTQNSPHTSLSDISGDVPTSTSSSQMAPSLMQPQTGRPVVGQNRHLVQSNEASNNQLNQGFHGHIPSLPEIGSLHVTPGSLSNMPVTSPDTPSSQGALNVSSDSQRLNSTSDGSSLNLSTDSVLARPSSAFKPPAKTGASRQNSSSSNPGETGSIVTPPAALTQNVNPLQNYFSDGQSRSSSSSPAPGSTANSQKPPRPPSRGREHAHHSRHWQLHQKHRSDNNVSPATTLWEPPESSIIHAPVILAPAPASPLTSPTHKAKNSPNTIPQAGPTAEATKQSNSKKEFPKGDGRDKAGERRRNRDTQDAVTSSERNDRLIEDTPKRDSNQIKNEDYPRRGKPRPQNSRESNSERGVKAERESQREPNYDRPPSRTDSLKDEYSQGYRYGDQVTRDPYGYRSRRGQEEEYDRPRSRQEEEKKSAGQEVTRPRSRAEYDRPRSRTDYERPRSRAEYDAYYDRDYRSRYPDYDYDAYYRRGAGSYYYDRDGYYDYHHNRYATGYYDEYYRYNQYQDQYGTYYQDAHAAYDDSDRHSQTSAHSHSRGNTPAQELEDQPVSHHGYSNRPHSRQYAYGHDDPQAYLQDQNLSYDNLAFSGYGYHPGYDYSGYAEYAQKPVEVGKFALPHVGIQFGSGGHLITIQPNRPEDGQPAVVELHEVQALLEDDIETFEMKCFPGPLIKGETHKNDVLMFCQMKARECRDNIDMVDRDSAELLWRFLELLIKQNGTVVGTDISDLLLEGHEPTTLEYKSSGVKISTSRSQSMENLLDVGEDESEKSVTVTSDRTVVNTRKTMAVEEVTDRFRHLLLYGRKKDSLDWAMKHNLWGHALFLASKMDNRTHANIMIRFANSSMRMNDPLQTLYQLMSGRQPAAVTCISDERWGDWRPHLAMVLSNNTPKPDLDRRSIVTLGDTLAARGYLHASHFCYLMAQVEFGTYAKKTSKLVLVGSSHNLPLEEFASNLAIQCTEIYEYAVTLGNPLSTMAGFQPYKFMYACRLAEYGFTQEALHYCEVIATTINQAPGLYQMVFVKQLFELSSRLKYYDPQRQEVGFELDDPFWLQQLQRACQGLEDGSIQPISGSATPGMTTGSSESGEIAGLTSAAEMTYNQFQTGQESDYVTDQWGQQYTQEQGQGQEQVQGRDVSQQYEGEGQVQQENSYGTQYDPSQYNQGYNYGYQQADQSTVTDGTNSYGAQAGYDQTSQINSQDHSAGQTGGQPDGGNWGPRYSFSSAGTEEVEPEARQDVLDGPQTTGMMLDYWGASTSHKVRGGPVRPRTTSGSSTQSTGRSRTMSGSSTHSVKASPYMNKTPQTIKPMDRTSQKQKKPAANGSGKGIFGYIAEKLNFSVPKNEMKLPKDEKPSIIWDSAKNRWVNTDGGEEEEEKPAAPPPKDWELSGPSAGPTQGGAGNGGPSLSNRFQIPKARGARNRYVDVLNPGSTTSSGPTSSAVPTSLFNVLPSSDSPPLAIFTPGSVPGSETNRIVDGSQASNNSNTLPVPSASTELTTGTQAIQQAEREAAQETSKNAVMPLMFDPTQFSAQQAQGQPQTFSQSGAIPSASSGGPRYGQRRQYPKKL